MEVKDGSQEIRDQVTDHLLMPKNAALIVIDYQPIQVSSIMSMDRQLLVENIVRVAKTARAYGLPIVVSTVNVTTGRNKPTIPELQDVLADIEPLDRTTINAWEGREFVAAVTATGRKRFIMTALWTEAGLTFPSLDAMREGGMRSTRSSMQSAEGTRRCPLPIGIVTTGEGARRRSPGCRPGRSRP